jgi:hypothetical protein
MIEGAVHSVSSADIRTVLEIVRRDMPRSEGAVLPIYTVRVVDRNHVEVCYWPGSIETCAVVDRIKGKWTLQPVQRIMIKGLNIPIS